MFFEGAEIENMPFVCCGGGGGLIFFTTKKRDGGRCFYIAAGV